MSRRAHEPQAPRVDPLGSLLARAVFESSTEGILVLNPEGAVLAVNRAFCDLYGIDAETAVGGSYQALGERFEVRRSGDPLEPEGGVALRALRGEAVRDVVLGLRNRATGKEFYGRYGASPVVEDGRFVATVVTVLDVTEATLAAQARLAAQLLGAATDAVPVFIAFMDADLVYRFCNRRFEEWFGRPREEIVGRSIREILGDATFAQLWPYLERALAGEPSAYAQWLDFPQGRRFMRASYMPSFDAQGRVDGLTAMIDDETEQRLTEERLRASEERLRRVVEAATVGVVVNDSEGRFLDANPPLLAMLGYTREDVEAGRLTWDRIQITELRAGDDLALEQLRAHGSCDPYETQLVARDGRRVPVYIGAAFVPDESGKGVLGAAFITDLTPLKAAQRELETLNRELDAKVRERTAELERANRDLSEFSYSVAHDLRAPLRAIVSTSRILLEDAQERLNEEEWGLLQRQATNGVRLARIVDDLLNFGRLAKADLRKREFDLTALARAAADEVRDRWSNGCEIVVEEGMRADGDPNLVGYALVNLLDNACKFSPAGGAVAVGQADGAFFVRDQGVGFGMEHAHKLFVAFERLVDQETFPGTGVGLANVKRIVERHGGTVWADSAPGKGATFFFTLSVITGDPSSGP